MLIALFVVFGEEMLNKGPISVQDLRAVKI